MQEEKHPVDELEEKIVDVILSSGMSYGETMSALNSAQNYLHSKCYNLTNAMNIREVVAGKR